MEKDKMDYGKKKGDYKAHDMKRKKEMGYSKDMDKKHPKTKDCGNKK